MKESFKAFLLSHEVFPLVLGLAVVGLLMVVFRMKGIETEYTLSKLSGEKAKILLENKELKAKKAKLLSIKRLKILSKKYNLHRPRNNQIILIK